jgi:hypothetical protein
LRSHSMFVSPFVKDAYYVYVTITCYMIFASI